MDDYREGELHYCEELKRRLVYPAKIEAQSLSERGEIALDECREDWDKVRDAEEEG